MSLKTKANLEGTIRLPKRLDYAAAETLRKDIAAARGSALCLQADEVEFLGGAGAELLLAVRAEWQNNVHSFSVSNPSNGFLEGLDRLGIQHSELVNEGRE